MRRYVDLCCYCCCMLSSSVIHHGFILKVNIWAAIALAGCQLQMWFITMVHCKESNFITHHIHDMLGRTHEKQWIRRSESTSAKREWIWIYESTAFECVLRLNTPQINLIFYDWVSCSWYILDEIVFDNYICIIIIIETLPLFPSYITYQL